MGNPIITGSELQFKNLIQYPNIQIEENKMTFLTGESGCGKSSLLRLLNATVSPSVGALYYQGKPYEEFDTILLRREILLASQMVYLFEESIQQNFNTFYAYREEIPPNKEVMQQYLSLCCADFDLDKNCSVLSGGEKQRVFLAICLSMQPKVILLDEPTSALDGNTAKQFFMNLKHHMENHDITVVAISHDGNLAEEFADNRIMLDRGNRL